MIKLFFSLILFAMISLPGCSRSDPASAETPDNIVTLKPLAVINLDIPEPSGIAYCSKSNTLFIVSDGLPDIFETDLAGVVIKTIPTTSSDMEGIALSKNCDTIFVAEERNQLITSYSLNGNRLSSFPVNVATLPNNALEGVTVDNSTGHLFVINEKLPAMILEFNNLVELWRKEINYTSDISDIYYEESSDCFWIVSDESKKVLKLSRDGVLISQWLISFSKGEGITIVGDKMYIVCDADSKMYVFQKP